MNRILITLGLALTFLLNAHQVAAQSMQYVYYHPGEILSVGGQHRFGLLGTTPVQARDITLEVYNMAGELSTGYFRNVYPGNELIVEAVPYVVDADEIDPLTGSYDTLGTMRGEMLRSWGWQAFFTPYTYRGYVKPRNGDITLDGCTNLQDIVRVIQEWGWTPSPGDLARLANVNLDHEVNVDDLVAVIMNYGWCQPP